MKHGDGKRIRIRMFMWLFCVLLPPGLRSALAADTHANAAMSSISREYVGLVLELGEHDPGYVDAYYGPAEWLEQAKARKRQLTAIASDAQKLSQSLAAAHSADPLEVRRVRFLSLQLESLLTRVEMLQGKKLSFDEESRRLYGVVAPSHDDDHYRKALQALEAAMPGKGTLAERAETLRQRSIVPADRIDAVFRRGLQECRERTLRHIDLPAGEDFRVEYVRGESWGAYNWYKGEAHSLIQVNLDPPFVAQNTLKLGCHEGYPGHHVLNALLEQRLVKDRGWVEFSVYPLYSPLSFIAEGTADFGLKLAFPNDTKWSWLRQEIFPMAGLDPEVATIQARIEEAAKPLQHLQIHVARRYLDGKMSRDEALRWLVQYRLVKPQEAERSLRFIEHYRSYVINYSYGNELVEAYVDATGGSDATRRWAVFEELISNPTVPADLAITRKR